MGNLRQRLGGTSKQYELWSSLLCVVVMVANLSGFKGLLNKFRENKAKIVAACQGGQIPPLVAQAACHVYQSLGDTSRKVLPCPADGIFHK